MNYNERKLSVLEALEDLGEATSFEVWETQGGDVSVRGIRMALLRYHRQGLLNRSGGVYSLSNRGFERLEYLRSVVQEE